MDQSASVVAITRSYGGSDSTKPSFNRQEFVHYGSRQDAKDLGLHDGLDARIEGFIGGDSGAQTLFFRFETTQSCRIGARILPQNPYSDQYISIGLRNSAEEYLPLGVDGFVGSSTYELQTTRLDSLVVLEAGYVIRDYWLPGYAVYDYAYVPRPQSGSARGSGIFASSFASHLPAGGYLLTISSSQWSQLPFAVQLVAIPNVELAGNATLTVTPQGRLTLHKLGGTASMALTPEAALGSLKNIPIDSTQAAVADLCWEPQARLQRRSPFG